MTVTQRVHFLDEQRRNRRTGRWVAVLVTLALFVSGIPLSVFISPALVLVAVVGAYIADIFTTVPQAAWQVLHDVVFILPDTWRAMRSDAVDVHWKTLFYVLVVPGTVAIVIAWIFVRLLFRRVGVGGVLRNLGNVRVPGAVASERKILNLVEEISVAAGVPTPRTLLVDSDAANVVAIGLDMNNATIVVTSGLVNKLTRDEAQAMIAHVMSSVGNGDLRIASTILSVIQTWGFFSLLIDTPFGPRSRRALRLVATNASDAVRGRLNVDQAEKGLDLLLSGSGELDDLMDKTDRIVYANDAHPLYDVFVTVPLLLTMGVASIASRMVVWMFTLLVAGPWIAALWRSRRRLADAGAVELTRNPDALRGALRTLSNTDVKVPGATMVNFLFPIWDKNVDFDETRTDISSALLRMHLKLDSRLATIERLGAQAELVDRSPRMTGLERARVMLRKTPEFMRDAAKLLGMLAGTVALMVALIVATLVAVTGALMAVWWILKLVFVRIPAWLVRVV